MTTMVRMMTMRRFQLTSDVDGGGLNVGAETVDTLTLVQTDVRHRHVPDDQLGTARDHLANRDPSAFLTSYTDQVNSNY